MESTMNARKDTTARRGGPDTDRGARLVLDEQGLIAEWNQAARELLGYPAEEVLGRPVARLLAREQPASPAATAGATVTARHRDGHRLDIRARVSALPGEGAAVRWCVLLDPADGTAAEVVDAALLTALLTESPSGCRSWTPNCGSSG